MEAETAMTQVLTNCDANPLDVLNDWRAGKLDNDAMFILMQRALLKLQTTPRMADPDTFAQMRNRSVNRKAALNPELPPARQLVNSVIEQFKYYRAPKPFLVSDSSYNTLVELAERMLADGLRSTKWIGVNILAGRDQMYKDYDGGKDFLHMLDFLVDGNDGAL